MDLGFASIFGLDRSDRKAIGLDATIATTFAHRLIDQDSFAWDFKYTSFAISTFFSGTLLVLDEGGHPFDVLQFCNGMRVFGFVNHFDIVIDLFLRILLRQFGDNGDFLHPFTF